MKFVEFKKSLQEIIEPIYLFYGEDRYLTETCIKNLKLSSEIEYPDFNIVSYGEDANFEDVLTACETLPLMDKMRIVIVKDIDFNEDKRKKLIEYAKKPNKSVTLAITIKGETKPIDSVTFVDCNKLDATMIRRKVLTDLKDKGFLISDEALKTLILYCDYNLTQIYSELDKLIAFADENKVITEEMIRTLSVRDCTYNIFELTEALGNKRSEDALKILDYLIDEEDHIALIGLLYGHYRRLLMVTLSPPDLDNATIADQLQIKPYAVKIARQQCRLFGKQKLYILCDKLHNIDLNIKSTFTNTKNELYSFVFSALN